MMVDVFIAVSVVVVVFYLMQPSGYLTAPFLFACVSLGWLAPQITTVSRTYPELEPHLQTYSLMSTLCLLAVFAGFELGRKRRQSVAKEQQTLARSMDEKSAYYVAVILTAVALLMTFLIGASSIEERANATWTGRITIYYFFQNIKMVSLFLSACLVMKRRSLAYIILIALNGALYFPGIFIFFRRRAIFEAFFTVSLAAFYVRQIRIPKMIVISGILVATIGVFAIGGLRGVAYDKQTQSWSVPTVAEINQIDFLSTAPFFGNVSSSEVRNGVTLVAAVESGGNLTLGRASWNRLVFQFVPAQFLGADFKSSLMFEGSKASDVLLRSGYSASLGSTITGIAEAYMEFSYLGSLVFFIFSWILGIAWRYMSIGMITGAVFYVIGLIPLAISPTAYLVYFVALAAPQVFLLMLATGLTYVILKKFTPMNLSRLPA